ncbi:MAG TPA: PA2779 family protein [Burkholderiales bacterium]|nr:PA2779 family protein [Burkholderiales bacterium]
MSQELRKALIEAFSVLLIGAALALFVPVNARAATISTDDAISAGQASQDRERIKALVARPELAQALEKLGIAPENAKARVDAMSDAEVRTVAGKLDALPAGGALSNTDFLLVVIIVILVVVLL